MTKEDIINRISKTYTSLSIECQNELSNDIKVLALEKNTILVKEGQYSDKTYYIIKGGARAYYLKDGKEVSDWFAFEDEFINSIISFFTNKPSPHYIDLLEDSILIELSRDKFEELADKYHEFERLIRVVVTQTMLKQQEKIASMQFYNADKKYENILAIRPDIIQRVPLTYIASYLGITLETLSRIRNRKNRI